jgi:hypothetical protein
VQLITDIQQSELNDIKEWIVTNGFEGSSRNLLMLIIIYTKKKLNSLACSPQANYTDRAAAA